MNLRQANGGGGRKLRRLIRTAPAVLLLMLAACGGSEPAATPSAEPTAQPAAVQTAGPSAAGAAGIAVETGGMALPGGAADGAQPTPTPSPTPPALQVGAVLTATGAVTLYAEPDPAAPRFAQYAAGSRFTVVEPDGDPAAYPVEADGHRWVRVRAEDGLVGWMMQE